MSGRPAACLLEQTCYLSCLARLLHCNKVPAVHRRCSGCLGTAYLLALLRSLLPLQQPTTEALLLLLLCRAVQCGGDL